MLHRPLVLIREMARVGKKCIVSFPNLATGTCGASFFLGHLPKSRRLPYEWYDTPNIRLLTIADFRAFCRIVGLKVLHEIALRTTSDQRCTRVSLWPNLRADAAIFVVEQLAGARGRGPGPGAGTAGARGWNQGLAGRVLRVVGTRSATRRGDECVDAAEPPTLRVRGHYPPGPGPWPLAPGR